jgi:hypothetical protein
VKKGGVDMWRDFSPGPRLFEDEHGLKKDGLYLWEDVS